MGHLEKHIWLHKKEVKENNFIQGSIRMSDILYQRTCPSIGAKQDSIT